MLFTFTRLVDPKQPFNRAFPATFVYAQSLGLAEMIAGIDRSTSTRCASACSRPTSTSSATSRRLRRHPLGRVRGAAARRRPGQRHQQPARRHRAVPASRATARTTWCACCRTRSYWRGRSRPTQLVFAISREPNVRVQKLAAGECHVSRRDCATSTSPRSPATRRSTILKNAGAEHLLPGAST